MVLLVRFKYNLVQKSCIEFHFAASVQLACFHFGILFVPVIPAGLLQMLEGLRRYLSRRNLVKKALVDERFLW